jgi:hypothetical protein
MLSHFDCQFRHYVSSIVLNHTESKFLINNKLRIKIIIAVLSIMYYSFVY